MHRQQEIATFIKTALECSLYVAPTSPGLSMDELLEIGSRVGFEKGEMNDAMRLSEAVGGYGDPRFRPGRMNVARLTEFFLCSEPDYRNIDAFQFIYEQLHALVRSEGAKHARIDRSVLLARVPDHIPAKDVQAALTISLLAEHLIEKDGALMFANGREQYPSPKAQIANGPPTKLNSRGQNPSREKVYALVLDVVARRTDGRPPVAESLEAFANELERLGYGQFRLWWMHTLSELRRAEPTVMPVCIAVLSAALVEAALAFVVTHAQRQGLAVFASKDFERPPNTWKIDDLVSSAAAGQGAAILDASARQRAGDLVKLRQRIHAGRMLVDFPKGVPDLRPEEARDAKATADIVVRRVCDWLNRYPPAGTTNGP